MNLQVETWGMTVNQGSGGGGGAGRYGRFDTRRREMYAMGGLQFILN